MNKSSNLEVTNNITHALLLVQTFCSDVDNFIYQYFENIIKASYDLDKDKLNQILAKLKNHEYYDLVVLDGKKEQIKKDDILAIQNQFSRSGLETIDCKFYVLKNFEFSTQQAVNSLLKFLEEPVENVYCVITCTNENIILPTIVSRCQKIRLRTNWEEVDSICKKHKLSTWQIQAYTYSFYDLHDFEEFLSSSNFSNINNFIETLYSNKISEKDEKQQLEVFKSWNYSEIYFVLNCLANCFQSNKKMQFLELLEDLKYNPNKVLLFFKIIEIIKE